MEYEPDDRGGFEINFDGDAAEPDAFSGHSGDAITADDGGVDDIEDGPEADALSDDEFRALDPDGQLEARGYYYQGNDPTPYSHNGIDRWGNSIGEFYPAGSRPSWYRDTEEEL
jgi:hypothetical protein